MADCFGNEAETMAIRQRIVVEKLAETDEALATRARIDRESFGLLYERYADPIFRYCNRRLNDDSRASEASAQVFSRALDGISRFRGEGPLSFRAWIFTIANRTVTDEYRRRTTEPIERAVEFPESNISYLPDRAAERSEARDTLRAALAQLSEEQRRIVELRLSGLNGVEIAAVLGKTHAAIKSSQFRAYARLRELLDIQEVD